MMSFTKAHSAAVIGALTLGLAALTPATQVSAAPVDAPEPLPTTAPTVDPTADAKPVAPKFTAEELRIMARSAGRSVDAQKAHLQRQAVQNNAYAALDARGLEYDGAYFDSSNSLVLQAPRTSTATAQAKQAGLKVRTPENGEAELNKIVDKLNSVRSDRRGISSVVPDIARDKVVITVNTAKADPAFIKAATSFGDAVVVERGEKNVLNADVRGGDKIHMDPRGGGYCSAGFPAKTRNGDAVMIWAGHCVENQDNFYNTSGQLIGTRAGTAFKSYDGQPDRDIGALWMESDSSMLTQLNQYRSTVSNAEKGAWKAPVGTELCKSGATTGITCGKVTGYNASVNYQDDSGRQVASVSGLGTSTVCTAPGDSGGAYVSGGYAVGMTSGGPVGQTCQFNGGYIPGKSSYFQPVSDALSYYGLTYGN